MIFLAIGDTMNVAELEALQIRVTPNDVRCEILDCMKAYYRRYRREVTHIQIPRDVEDVLLTATFQDFRIKDLQERAINPQVPFAELRYADLWSGFMGLVTIYGGADDVGVIRIGCHPQWRNCTLKTMRQLRQQKALVGALSFSSQRPQLRARILDL